MKLLLLCDICNFEAYCGVNSKQMNLCRPTCKNNPTCLTNLENYIKQRVKESE